MSQIIKTLVSGGPLPPEIPTSFQTDSGVAIPVANVIQMRGTTVSGSGISTSGSGNIVAYRMAPNYNLSDFAFQNLAGATPRTLEVFNQDTDASSRSILRCAVDGASLADPYLQVGINAVMNYCWGIDNSDSDTLKIAANANSVTASPSGGTILYTLTSTGNATYTTGNLAVERSAVSGTVISTVSNLSAAANSNALFRVVTADPTAGDPLITYIVSGGGVWSTGIDNTDSDSFVISNATALGTNNAVSWSIAGTMKTFGGQVVKVTTPGAYPYTTLVSDYFILVDTSAARTINLLASPETGRTYRIKDNVGSAATNNITITPAAGNIDGSASYVMNVNYGSVDVVYNGTQWNIL